MKYLHQNAAREQGYTIDDCAAGRPVAYKGPRFAPTAIMLCYTELESDLIYALDRMVKMHNLMMRKTNHGASYYDARCIAEMNGAPMQAVNALRNADVDGY